MPAFLLPMDVLIAPMVLLASSAAADLQAGRRAGPRATARATVSARIVRGESVRFESPDSRASTTENDQNQRRHVLPKARDRKNPETADSASVILIEFY